MSVYETLELLRERPGMYLPKIDFYNTCSFINGLNQASDLKLLEGFSEWLSINAPSSTKSLWWPHQISALAFPGGDGEQWEQDAEQQQKAIEVLFQNLEKFIVERDAPGGLDAIMKRFDDSRRHKAN